MNYLKTIYSEERKPYTNYPAFLVTYLKYKLNLIEQKKLLDLGCGRGDFLQCFWILNFRAEGFDREELLYFKHIPFTQGDFNKDLPYEDNTFDIIFCKSVIEHTHTPEHIFSEAYRILKPNGLFIVMTPDWESVYKYFYEDFTHKTPFMIQSLRDIYLIHNFKDVHCEKFIQLPWLWDKPYLKFICEIAKLFYTSDTKNKLIKFSKEKMLLGVGVK